MNAPNNILENIKKIVMTRRGLVSFTDIIREDCESVDVGVVTPPCCGAVGLSVFPPIY